MVISETELQ